MIVNLKEYWPQKKSPQKSGVDMVRKGKKRAPKIDSLALSPTRGWLRGRLDDSVIYMPVLPDAPPGTTMCQLHQWVYKEFNHDDDAKNCKPAGSHSQVMLCRTCQVNLFLNCWEFFHTKEHLQFEIPRILGV